MITKNIMVMCGLKTENEITPRNFWRKVLEYLAIFFCWTETLFLLLKFGTAGDKKNFFDSNFLEISTLQNYPRPPKSHAWSSMTKKYDSLLKN